MRRTILIKLLFGIISGLSVAMGSWLWNRVLQPSIEKLVAKTQKEKQPKKIEAN